MALMKNTVRLRAEFRNFDQELSDPSDITLTIYKQVNNQIMTSASPADIVRESLGTYHYDYLVPLGVGNLYYEWSGTLDTTVITNRAVLSRELFT